MKNLFYNLEIRIKGDNNNEKDRFIVSQKFLKYTRKNLAVHFKIVIFSIASGTAASVSSFILVSNNGGINFELG